MDSEHQARQQTCGVASKAVDISVSEGKNAVVKLSYDPSTLLQINKPETVITQIPTSLDCLYNADGTVWHCPYIAADSTFTVSLE